MKSGINNYCSGFLFTILRFLAKYALIVMRTIQGKFFFIKQILLVLIVSTCYLLKAQPTNGSSGLLNTPNAEMKEDGTFIIGSNYLPVTFTSTSYNTVNYYFNLTFIPFLEVTYRLTLMRMQFEDNRNLNEDRSFGLRMRLVRERKYIPAIVLGGDDIFTSSGNGNQYFGSTYIVGTKTINWNDNRVSINLGNGFNSFERKNLNGIFGGISYSPQFFNQLNFIAEYDTKALNLGASLLLFDCFFLYAFINQNDSFMGGIAYHINLQ